jgi:hypothetical protein
MYHEKSGNPVDARGAVIWDRQELILLHYVGSNNAAANHVDERK